MNEWIESESGQIVLYLVGIAAGAVFTALKGTDLYERHTNRRQRWIIDLVGRAVAYTYSTYVRPQKIANGGSLTIRDKNRAEDKAVQYVVTEAQREGVTIPTEKLNEIRAEVVREVARAKAAGKTKAQARPTTKGGI